jgi:hypothetical protein
MQVINPEQFSGKRSEAIPAMTLEDEGVAYILEGNEVGGEKGTLLRRIGELLLLIGTPRDKVEGFLAENKIWHSHNLGEIGSNTTQQNKSEYAIDNQTSDSLIKAEYELAVDAVYEGVQHNNPETVLNGVSIMTLVRERQPERINDLHGGSEEEKSAALLRETEWLDRGLDLLAKSGILPPEISYVRKVVDRRVFGPKREKRQETRESDIVKAAIMDAASTGSTSKALEELDQTHEYPLVDIIIARRELLHINKPIKDSLPRPVAADTNGSNGNGHNGNGHGNGNGNANHK